MGRRRGVQVPISAAVIETPLETYAREGKLMAGCAHGGRILKQNGKEVMDVNKKPIYVGHCNKMCDAGETLCPRHLAMMHAKASAPAKVPTRS